MSASERVRRVVRWGLLLAIVVSAVVIIIHGVRAKYLIGLGGGPLHAPCAALAGVVFVRASIHGLRRERIVALVGLLCIVAVAVTDQVFMNMSVSVSGNSSGRWLAWAVWGMDAPRVVGMASVLYCGLAPAWRLGSARRLLAATAAAAVLAAVIVDAPVIFSVFPSFSMKGTLIRYVADPAWVAAVGSVLAICVLSVTDARAIAPGRVRRGEIVADGAVRCPVCASPCRPLGDDRFACASCEAEMVIHAHLTKCPACRYSLEGIAASVCPECGADLNFAPTPLVEGGGSPSAG